MLVGFFGADDDPAMNESRDSKSLYMTVLMTPDMANFAGNVHGGTLLKLLDQVAYSCASRYAGTYVVTLSVDRVLFHGPIHVGELVSFSATVNHTGRTSLEVGIRVDTENRSALPPGSSGWSRRVRPPCTNRSRRVTWCN